jgi:TetR/AcrR family transcriptional repressor of nem operon
MPYPKDHKQKSRQRILTSAAKLFTAKGFDNTSIDEIMADAHLTRGAFYAHFSTKSELYAQAILFAATNSPLACTKVDGKQVNAILNKLLEDYLSVAHLNNAMPCPLAFLATDVANRDPQVRKTYTQVYKGMNKILASHLNNHSGCHEKTIWAVTAMMIGGVAVSRALDDKRSVRQLLKSCQNVAQALLKTKEEIEVSTK